VRERDHIRIGNAVINAYGAMIAPVSSDVLQGFRDGSILPDNEKPYRTAAHHHSRELDIVWLITRGRQEFLNNNLGLSAKYLGAAFHFIADGTCPSTKDGATVHRVWEQKVSKIRLPDMPAGGTKFEIRTPSQLSKLTFSKTSANPEASITNSINMCYAILELAWRPLDRLTAEEQLSISKAKAVMPSKSSKFISNIIGVLCLALFFGSIIVTSRGYSPWFFIGMLPFPLYSVAYLYSESREKKAKFLNEWYRFSK